MIPKQLKREEFGFTFLVDKRPYEPQWQNNPHTYEEAQARLASGKNYGVATGYGGLIVIDCDCNATVKLADELTPTFTVKSSKGLHLYYICPELKSKIIFKDIPEVFEPGETHCGEIMSYGAQVVGPGSIHPVSKQPYEVWSDLPIATIELSEIERVFDSFIKRDLPVESKPVYNTITTNLQVTDISGFQQSGLYEHPIHGATNGGNFSINKELNVWHCFRCSSGGGPMSLIGVMEGIIDCSDCHKGALRGEKFKEVKAIATSKYNYQDDYKHEEQYQESTPVPIQPEKIIDITMPQYLNDLSVSKVNIDWIWEGYIAKGKITLFSAIWKVGKSTLLSLLIKHVSQNTNFVGATTNKTNTLVITEEDEQDWVTRRELYGGLDGVWVHTYPFSGKPSQKDWTAYFDKITAFCQENSIDFVIIDTLANLGPLQDENNSVDVSNTMSVFKKLTKENIGVMVIHHTTKVSGDISTRFRGSGAFGGFVDCLMTMDRVKDSESQRAISTIGRREFSKAPITVELRNIGTPTEDYELLGVSTEVIKADIKDLVIGAFEISDDKAMTISQICKMIEDDTDASESSIRRQVELLVKNNVLEVTKIKEGRTNKLYYSVSINSGLFNG